MVLATNIVAVSAVLTTRSTARRPPKAARKPSPTGGRVEPRHSRDSRPLATGSAPSQIGRRTAPTVRRIAISPSSSTSTAAVSHTRLGTVRPGDGTTERTLPTGPTGDSSHAPRRPSPTPSVVPSTIDTATTRARSARARPSSPPLTHLGPLPAQVPGDRQAREHQREEGGRDAEHGKGRGRGLHGARHLRSLLLGGRGDEEVPGRPLFVRKVLVELGGLRDEGGLCRGDPGPAVAEPERVVLEGACAARRQDGVDDLSE